jgi:inorganic pyrophosphatase
MNRSASRSGRPTLAGLAPFRAGRVATVVVETPRGSASKLAYRDDLGTFELERVLPAGMAFPFDFGFIPSTLAADGDPIDVLILIDAPLPPGCVVPTRLVGVIEASQTENDGTAERNDRLIGVAAGSGSHASTTSIKDLDDDHLGQIEAFFVDYNRLAGKDFRPLRRRGRRAAWRLAQAARKHAADRSR